MAHRERRQHTDGSTPRTLSNPTLCALKAYGELRIMAKQGNGSQTTCDSPYSQSDTRPMETSTRVADATGGVCVFPHGLLSDN